MERGSGAGNMPPHQNTWNSAYIDKNDEAGNPQRYHQFTGGFGPTYEEGYGNWQRQRDAEPLSIQIPPWTQDPRDPSQGGSVPHTPDAPIPPPASFTQHRLGSISSIASSEDESIASVSQHPWTEQQDALVMETFDIVTSDPTSAPFSGKFPPSGITHRVAHDTVKAARRQRVLFPHRLPAIRHRILVLYSRREEFNDRPEDPPESDYFGNSGMEGIVDDDYGTREADGSAEFDFADTHERYQERPSFSRFRESLGGVGVLPVGATTSLASPFTETPPNVTNVTNVSGQAVDEREISQDILNVVAKRKRDSLRLKRGLQ